MDKLKLTFPSAHPGSHLLVETRVDAFSHWLESLPSGNMPIYVKQLADAIININRTELPIAHRMQLVVLVDEAYENIHNYYRPLMKTGPHKGNHAPLDELKEVYRLTQELSFSYKIAVYAYLDKRTLFGKNKKLAHAINMTMHYLGLVLLEHYELYTPIPLHIWREVHQLYFYAEQNELSEISIANKNLFNFFSTSEETYIRLCMISLSNPYHLKRGDHWEVFTYLSYWTSKAIMSDDPDDFSEKNCFVINLSGDDKPLSLKILPKKESPYLRYLLTDQLTLKIAHNIDEIQSSNKSLDKCFSKNVIARKATQLLNDMLISWESKRERLAPRYPKINRMEVIWGLQNIHAAISLNDPIQERSNSQDSNDISNLIEQSWNTINDSDGGTCISQPTEKIKDIDVGLLVAIRNTMNDNTSSKWHLGVICWITGNKRNGTQVGIKYMNGDIQAVQIQARKGNKIDTRFHNALMLSGEKVQGLSTPTLLVANGLYLESRPMVLQVGEEMQNIHARLLVSSSGSIDRFFYQHDLQETSNQVENQDGKETEVVEAESEDGEVIDLSAMPMTHAEDYENPNKEEERVVTLDDMIVSKNK